MTGIEKFVVIVISIFLIARLLRFLFPYLLKWWVSRLMKRTNPQAYEEMKAEAKAKRKKKDNVVIKNTNQQTGDKESYKGDYIDFEEL